MPSVFHIPTGPANLAKIFPTINWNNVEEYYVEVDSIATSPLFTMQGCEDDIVISFINYLGAIDSIGLNVTIEHDTKSSFFQKPLKSPLVKALPGTARLNIKSNDNYAGTCTLPEDHMKWLDELFDSPLAWMQVAAVQGQPADYIPIVITDQSSVKKKDADRYSYDVTIKFSLSNERIIISN